MSRIVFVTGQLSHGGAERHAVTLVNRLAERGHDCHLAYLKGENMLSRELRGGATRALGAQRYLDRPALQRLAAQLEALRPDVVVAANGYALMYSWFALRRWNPWAPRVPLVLTYHSTRLLGVKEQAQMLAYRPLFWSTDCAVFVAERQRRYCARRGILARRNLVIHNGIDTEHFRDAWSSGERNALRAAHGIAASDFIVGMSGLLRPEKNHLQMVEAIARLRQQGLRACALLIGDGPMRAAVEARARALGVGDQVRITGVVDDVRPHVAACDVLALCSSTEALSLAALEAMSMGRPVVHTDVGGAAELIQSGENGFLVPVGDTAALVERLAQLADGNANCRMGRLARRTIEQRFSERLMLSSYERLLRELSRSIRTMPAAQALNSGARQ
jgi:glycosyltransferase involved in cell wall biosynthesis